MSHDDAVHRPTGSAANISRRILLPLLWQTTCDHVTYSILIPESYPITYHKSGLPPISLEPFKPRELRCLILMGLYSRSTSRSHADHDSKLIMSFQRVTKTIRESTILCCGAVNRTSLDVPNQHFGIRFSCMLLGNSADVITRQSHEASHLAKTKMM